MKQLRCSGSAALEHYATEWQREITAERMSGKLAVKLYATMICHQGHRYPHAGYSCTNARRAGLDMTEAETTLLEGGGGRQGYLRIDEDATNDLQPWGSSPDNYEQPQSPSPWSTGADRDSVRWMAEADQGMAHIRRPPRARP